MTFILIAVKVIFLCHGCRRQALMTLGNQVKFVTAEISILYQLYGKLEGLSVNVSLYFIPDCIR